jgi:hypothetical protein
MDILSVRTEPNLSTKPQDQTKGSNDWVERLILIEKKERAYSAEKAMKVRSDSFLRQ